MAEHRPDDLTPSVPDEPHPAGRSEPAGGPPDAALLRDLVRADDLAGAQEDPVRAAPSSCAWLVRLPVGRLVCARHDQPTYPWSRARGCALSVATLCHVCRRTPVPVAHRFGWWFLCDRCRAIEAHLAAPFGLDEMTPYRGQGHGELTVMALLFPELLPRHETSETVSADGARTRTRVTVDPPDGTGLTRLLRFAAAETARLAGSAARDVGFDAWRSDHPASATASAGAYRRFIESTHPWIDSVEPRTADLAWLATLAEAPPRDGRRRG